MNRAEDYAEAKRIAPAVLDLIGIHEHDEALVLAVLALVHATLATAPAGVAEGADRFLTGDGWCGCLAYAGQHSVGPRCGSTPMPPPSVPDSRDHSRCTPSGCFAEGACPVPYSAGPGSTFVGNTIGDPHPDGYEGDAVQYVSHEFDPHHTAVRNCKVCGLPAGAHRVTSDGPGR